MFTPSIHAAGKPILAELISLRGDGDSKFNVARDVGARYFQLCVFLLKDDHGNIAAALEKEHSKNGEDINREVLRRWLNGEGLLPVSWATLIGVLKDMEQDTLAKKIESYVERKTSQ